MLFQPHIILYSPMKSSDRKKIYAALSALKPIFHCDAKTLALGPRIGLDAKFHVGNTNMLVSKNAKTCVSPNAKPQCKSVEYRVCWVPNANFLALAMYISLLLV